MNVVKSLHAGVIHRVSEVFDEHLFTVSSLWGFELTTGEPVLEQKLWSSVAACIAEGEVFDAGYSKVTAEYLVSCSFVSPEPVTGGLVEIEVGGLKKKLAIFGDRYWSASGFIGPELISSMPIRYENAFGGKASSINPAGKGLDEVLHEGVLRTPLPNVEYYDRLMTAKTDRPDPASLNRVEPTWAPRQEMAGTYDKKYIEERMPGFPEDIDPLYFNEAPEDQRFKGFLVGDEYYRLSGLNQEHPNIAGKLPGIRARIFLEVEGEDESKFIELENELDTVWFFPNENMGVLIHRANYPAQTRSAAEITKVIIGHELLSDEKRSEAHYEDQLNKRSDPEEGFKYLLNTTDIIPRGVTCGIKKLNSETGGVGDGVALENLAAYVDNQITQAKDQVSDQVKAIEQLTPSDVDTPGVDELINRLPESSSEQQKVEALIEKILPGYSDSNIDLDLTRLDLKAIDGLTEYIDELSRENEDKAIAALKEQISALRETNPVSDVADQLEEALDMRGQPLRLPRVSRDIDQQMDGFRAQIEAAKKELVILQSMGVDPSTVKQDIVDIDDLEEKLKISKLQVEEAYRLAAHYMDNARSPHTEPMPDLRANFMSLINGEETLDGWDGAFSDLSKVVVSDQIMKNAYLEYLDASNSEWVDVDFTESIFVHANMEGARFVRCRFKDANLGANIIDGTVFEDCIFEGTGFGKAKFMNARFVRCVFSDKMDAFLESTFQGVVFVDCELKLNNFIEIEIKRCRFERTVLDESSFIDCDMQSSSFEACSLKGVNFVGCDLSEAKFDESNIDNVRFLNKCLLEKSSFKKSTANLANFRECDFTQADFSHAKISQSDFSGATLVQANLNNSYIRECILANSNLERANLDKVDAMESSFQDARLTGTSLKNANLYGASFYGVIVGETDFSGANLKKTLFKDWRPGSG